MKTNITNSRFTYSESISVNFTLTYPAAVIWIVTYPNLLKAIAKANELTVDVQRQAEMAVVVFCSCFWVDSLSESSCYRVSASLHASVIKAAVKFTTAELNWQTDQALKSWMTRSACFLSNKTETKQNNFIIFLPQLTCFPTSVLRVAVFHMSGENTQNTQFSFRKLQRRSLQQWQMGRCGAALSAFIC